LSTPVRYVLCFCNCPSSKSKPVTSTLSRATLDLVCMAHNLCFPAKLIFGEHLSTTETLPGRDRLGLDSEHEIFFGQYLGYGIGTATKSAHYPARKYHMGGCIICGAASTCTEQRPSSTFKRAVVGHPRILTISTAQLCTYSLASRLLPTIVTDNPQQQHELTHR